MKYGLPGVITLLMTFTASAENYRVVYSPSQALEVFIDNVASNAPKDWCQETLHLRIVASENEQLHVLDNFLPRVGALLTSQCGTLQQLPWQMTNKQNVLLASGNAIKTQNWQTMITTDANVRTESSTAGPPASNLPLQSFALPGGCHFRTWWDERKQSLFIPDDPALRCSTAGWLEGTTALTLSNNDKITPLTVYFHQGYPLTNLHPVDGVTFDVVAINPQRMVIARADAPGSWLVLPFDPTRHVWSFTGTLLVKMDPTAAQNPASVKKRVDAAKNTWAVHMDASQKVTVLLTDDLHDQLADPASASYRTIN